MIDVKELGRKFLNIKLLTPENKNLTAIDYWHEKILLFIYMIYISMGSVVYVFSNILSYMEGLWGVMIVNTIAYLVVLYFFFNKKRSYNVRASIICVITYFIGMAMLIFLGSVGAGPIWLFSFPIISVILFNLQTGILAFLINVLSLMGMLILIKYNIVSWKMLIENPVQAWAVDSINYLLLNFVITVTVGMLKRGMKKAISESEDVSNELEKERKELEKTNQKLELEIFERVRSEKELKLSEEKFRTITEHLPVGIYRVNNAGTFLFVNKYMSDMFGYENPKEFIKEHNIKIINKDLLSHDKISVREFELNSLFNTRIILRDISIQIKTPYGVLYDGILENITESVKYKEEIESLNKDLEQRVKDRTAQLEDALEELRNEMSYRQKTNDELLRTKDELSRALEKEKELHKIKSHFISVVSHEYKTPLTVILTSSELIKKYFKTQNYEKFFKHIDKISNSVTKMNDLLNDILYLREMEKSDEHKYEEIEIISFTKEIVDELVNDDNKIHLYSENPEIYMMSKSRELQSILENLISNALKYSVENPVSIYIRKISGFLEIKVEDSGYGISEEDQEHIFEQFYRSAAIAHLPGTGLGLSIVKRSVEALNGRIYLNSEINEGSVFRVILPIE